jgi:hypothetical protein
MTKKTAAECGLAAATVWIEAIDTLEMNRRQ